uniref:EF-hand domain-containing protein n=1 Tax=Arcella intermedia TaxID=1963864 RepID=A0A6B2LRC5_9EUKA
MTYEEFKEIVKSIKPEMKEGQLKEMFASIDESSSGKVTYSDFKLLMEKKMKSSEPTSALREAFKSIDVNSTGKIHVGELRYVLTGIGNKLTDEEMDDILKDLNVQNGYLDYEDLLKLLVD